MYRRDVLRQQNFATTAATSVRKMNRFSIVLSQSSFHFTWESNLVLYNKVNRKVQGVPQSQTAANPRPPSEKKKKKKKKTKN